MILKIMLCGSNSYIRAHFNISVFNIVLPWFLFEQPFADEEKPHGRGQTEDFYSRGERGGFLPPQQQYGRDEGHRNEGFK